MSSPWRRVVDSVVEVVFPPACVACDEVLSEATCFCEACGAEVLDLPQVHCVRCAEPGAFDGDVCGHCRLGTPWEKAYAPFEHEGALARAIHRFKYEDRSDLARPLGVLLAASAASVLQAMPGVLVPIPLHVSRFRERKYDQAALLAAVVAQQVGREIKPDWLERVRETGRQVGLSEADRELNVSNAFFAPAQARGADVVLVDDVLTSGATARAAGRVLLDAGARRVSVLTLARARRVHAF